jgi:hypothetical protein
MEPADRLSTAAAVERWLAPFGGLSVAAAAGPGAR